MEITCIDKISSCSYAIFGTVVIKSQSSPLGEAGDPFRQLAIKPIPTTTALDMELLWCRDDLCIGEVYTSGHPLCIRR